MYVIMPPAMVNRTAYMLAHISMLGGMAKADELGTGAGAQIMTQLLPGDLNVPIRSQATCRLANANTIQQPGGAADWRPLESLSFPRHRQGKPIHPV